MPEEFRLLPGWVVHIHEEFILIGKEPRQVVLNVLYKEWVHIGQEVLAILFNLVSLVGHRVPADFIGTDQRGLLSSLVKGSSKARPLAVQVVFVLG